MTGSKFAPQNGHRPALRRRPPAAARRLYVLVYPLLAAHKLGVFVGGPDGPCILRQMALLLQQHGLDVVACHGERLQSLQGTCFEIALRRALTAGGLLRLQKELADELAAFEPPAPFLPAERALLEVNRPRDDKELLFAAAKVLGDHQVNLAFFRFDRYRALRGPSCGSRLPVLAQKAKLSARLELPQGLPLARLKQRLRAACGTGDDELQLSLLSDARGLPGKRPAHPACRFGTNPR